MEKIKKGLSKVIGKMKEKALSTSPVFKHNLRVSLWAIALSTGLMFTFTNLAVLKVVVTIMIVISAIIISILAVLFAIEVKDKVIAFISKKLGGLKNGAN